MPNNLAVGSALIWHQRTWVTGQSASHNFFFREGEGWGGGGGEVGVVRAGFVFEHSFFQYGKLYKRINTE